MQAPDDLVENRTRFSAHHLRQSIDEDVRRRQARLWNRIRMLVRNITDRFANSTVHPIGVTEIDLHDLWYMVIETAKITSAWDAAADQLVAQVVVARQLGRIRRLYPRDEDSNNEQHGTQQGLYVQEAIMTSGACMWIDLPFLTEDLRSAWSTRVDDMTIVERENLAGFCGRLSASGVCDPDITSCCLVLFRNSLETPRRMSVHDATAAAEYADRAPLSDFMPAIIAWLWYGSFQILDLCARNHRPAADSGQYAGYISVGELFTNHNVTPPNTGFSMSRWGFWKHRLHAFQRHSTDLDLIEQGRKSVHIMDSWEDITGGRTHDREMARNAFFHGVVR